MPVVDVCIGNHMNQFSRHQAAYLCKHVDKHRILHHIPVVGCKNVLRALVEYGIKLITCDIKGHTVCAWLKIHLGKVIELIYISKNSARVRCVLKLPEHIVHLVHFSLSKFIFYSHLIAIGFTDGAVFICPFIPYVRL